MLCDEHRQPMRQPTTPTASSPFTCTCTRHAVCRIPAIGQSEPTSHRYRAQTCEHVAIWDHAARALPEASAELGPCVGGHVADGRGGDGLQGGLQNRRGCHGRAARKIRRRHSGARRGVRGPACSSRRRNARSWTPPRRGPGRKEVASSSSLYGSYPFDKKQSQKCNSR